MPPTTSGDDEACGIDGGQSPAYDPDKNVYLAVVTSMFLHGGLLHIGGNLLFLWVFGNNVEEAFGKVGYALFYLAGGVVATLAHVVLNLDSTVALVGASGAIAAVMGAYFVLFPTARCAPSIFVLLIFFAEPAGPHRAGLLVPAAVLHRPQPGRGVGRPRGRLRLRRRSSGPSSAALKRRPSRSAALPAARPRDPWGNHPRGGWGSWR